MKQVVDTVMMLINNMMKPVIIACLLSSQYDDTVIIAYLSALFLFLCSISLACLIGKQKLIDMASQEK